MTYNFQKALSTRKKGKELGTLVWNNESISDNDLIRVLYFLDLLIGFFDARDNRSPDFIVLGLYWVYNRLYDIAWHSIGTFILLRIMQL
jgi:hypothetical protein